MIPNVISGAAWAMIYRFIFNNEFGLLNSLIRTVNPNFNVNWFYESPASFWAITCTWLFYAVVISLVVLADLMAISSDIHEAAIIDGASGFQIMTSIDLPLCRFSIGTSVIMGVTSRIGMYESIALTSRGGPGDDTMSLSLILVRNITDNNYGLANATGMIMLLLGAFIMFMANKVFHMNEPVA
jgi:raffinose/stachyose/melibiose transport system permease protein